MARFRVYRLPGGQYVVDVQADLLRDFKTRIVVPLVPQPIAPQAISRLNPVLEVDGQSLQLMPQLLAAVALRELSEEVWDLSDHGDSITAALDFAFQGF